MTWVPNRKVLAAIVAGAFAWAMMRFFAIDLPDDIDTAVGTLVAVIVAYFVPLPGNELPANENEPVDRGYRS